MIPVLAVALLPASYFGTTAALDHMNGGLTSPLASCVSSGCGSTAMSPEAASTSAAASASRAGHARRSSRPRARHTPAAHPSAAADHQGGVTPPATSSRPSPRASKPRPSRTASPPPAPQRPQATVSYQPEQRWLGGFTGQFTIANDGQRTIGNWQLTVTLPGDQVRDVQGADWYTSGDTLVMQPPHGSGPLEPGSSLTISIVAFGTDDTPATCSVNGRTCQP